MNSERRGVNTPQWGMEQGTCNYISEFLSNNLWGTSRVATGLNGVKSDFQVMENQCKDFDQEMS